MAYNKIILNGKQRCDYLYIQKDAPSEGKFACVGDEPSEWESSTILYANFNNSESPLNAGDSNLVGNISGYEVYRQKYNESVSEYIGTIQKSEDNVNDLMIDYAVRNGVEYTYYFYPNTKKTQSGTELSPLVTKQVSIDCPYWSLFIVDETEEENVFYLDKMFKFELNLEINDMTNNAQVSITQNFTKYPTVQYGTANYWSGSLSSLCGFLSTSDTDYIQTTNMIDELKSLSSDTRRKFLKDMAGNLWEVNASAPLNISTVNTASNDLKTLRFSWVEVGDTKGISIINNPKKSVTNWVLTETGEVLPYFTYTWGEQYRWDNSYYWTSNDETHNVQNSNLGRNKK